MLQLTVIALKALEWLFYIIAALIMIQALLSWLPGLMESRFGSILTTLTEPLNAPIRRFLERFETLRNFPIDFSPTISFFLIMIAISVIQTILAFLAASAITGG